MEISLKVELTEVQADCLRSYQECPEGYACIVYYPLEHKMEERCVVGSLAEKGLVRYLPSLPYLVYYKITSLGKQAKAILSKKADSDQEVVR